jgi:hypothetical protein
VNAPAKPAPESPLPTKPEEMFRCDVYRCRMRADVCVKRQLETVKLGNHPPKARWTPCGLGTCNQGARVAASLSGAPVPAQVVKAKPAAPAAASLDQGPDVPPDAWATQAFALFARDAVSVRSRTVAGWDSLVEDPWDDRPIGPPNDPAWAPFWALNPGGLPPPLERPYDASLLAPRYPDPMDHLTDVDREDVGSGGATVTQLFLDLEPAKPGTIPICPIPGCGEQTSRRGVLCMLCRMGVAATPLKRKPRAKPQPPKRVKSRKPIDPAALTEDELLAVVKHIQGVPAKRRGSG